MGKISPVSAKYIIHSTIEIDGIVDRPDVVGAIFGQTEGLLGTDLELRELQRSGRIGRIEVNLDNKSGKTQGTIVVPSSLFKYIECPAIFNNSFHLNSRCSMSISVLYLKVLTLAPHNQPLEQYFSCLWQCLRLRRQTVLKS